MSLNHVIDPLANPKYNIYCNDIDAEGNLKASNIAAGNLSVAEINANYINASVHVLAPTIISNEYINYKNSYTDRTFSTNDYIFPSSSPTGWATLNDVRTFIISDAKSSTDQPNMETYHITIDGVVETSQISIFEFRSREGYSVLLDCKVQVRGFTGDGVFSSFGCTVSAPDDALNDFKIKIAPMTTFAAPSVPLGTMASVLTIEIKVLMLNPPP